MKTEKLERWLGAAAVALLVAGGVALGFALAPRGGPDLTSMAGPALAQPTEGVTVATTPNSYQEMVAQCTAMMASHHAGGEGMMGGGMMGQGMMGGGMMGKGMMGGWDR